MISTCIFCGCGCKLDYIVKDGRVVGIKPVNEPVSEGVPCVKGLSIPEMKVKRIKVPLYRENKNKDFDKVDWKYVYEILKEKIEQTEEDDMMFVSSGEITNEDNYVLQKFARVIAKTNNIDNTARLCHSPTVLAYERMLGNPVNPNFIKDIEDLDLILLVGTDPFSTYPVAFHRILKAKKKGAKIIYLHHLKLKTSEFSDYNLIVRPGTEIVAIASVLNYLFKSGLYRNIDGMNELRDDVKEIGFDFASEVCGVSASLLKEVADKILESRRFGVMHGMGLTQQVSGTENVEILLALCFLKDGKILSLRGKINIQGAGDMLAHPWIGIKKIEELEKKWRVSLPKFKGKTLIESILVDPVKFLWISSSDLAVSLPDLGKVHRNLKKMFVVLANPFFNFTSNFSNLLLPTPMLFEREGSITNGEGRVRYVRKILESNSIPEWRIFNDLAGWNYRNIKEITREIVRVIGSYSKVDVEKLYNGIDQFIDKEIKFKRIPKIKIEGVNFWNLKKHKFILTSFRSYYHFLTGDLTRSSKTLRSGMEEPILLVNPMDADELRIKDGEMVRVSSDVGSQEIKVKLSDAVYRKVVASVFHFNEFLFNKLVPLEMDEETQIPNYKGIPVTIEKIL